MKVGLAGTGWRAQMYVRVMKALGEEFEVSAVYVHSESSREREEKNFPGKVYTDYDEFLATNHPGSSLTIMGSSLQSSDAYQRRPTYRGLRSWQLPNLSWLLLNHPHQLPNLLLAKS